MWGPDTAAIAAAGVTGVGKGHHFWRSRRGTGYRIRCSLSRLQPFNHFKVNAMSKLLDYLNTLDKDAAAREAFTKDPQAAMTQYGLNEAEQAALMSEDKAAIAQLIGIEVGELHGIQVVVRHYKPD
jgi:hypothetical protein